jgi:hypothetical protein
MTRYIVIESTEETFKDKFFEIETQIRTEMDLPFTDEQYRCVMHDGINVKLVHNEKIIIGTVR